MLLVYVLLAKQPNKQLNICVKLGGGGGDIPQILTSPLPLKKIHFSIFSKYRYVRLKILIYL